jgi:hypothetical protein
LRPADFRAVVLRAVALRAGPFFEAFFTAALAIVYLHIFDPRPNHSDAQKSFAETIDSLTAKKNCSCIFAAMPAHVLRKIIIFLIFQWLSWRLRQMK